ncbi:MAG: 3-deoxy-manno-octulosonate cytidylyltransferase [Gammaproteobacteria bacterium]|nr:3-deoxy-manno-octulosonate cytidylyltransferase [Gammaproteobacteria bacterium]
MTGFSVVIPARFASTRLPGKPLADIVGMPMIARVAAEAARSAAERVVVATDDRRVLSALSSGAASRSVEGAMTASDHASGSDRTMEVAEREGWADDHVVVNVQGDEPLIPPAVIDQVAGLLHADASRDVATLSEPLQTLEDVFDENVVKVVVSRGGRALYFSRAPVPFARGRFDGRQGPLPSDAGGWRRHVGIYAYRVRALRRFVALPRGTFEATESLEQLRFLENDIDIVVADAVAPVPGGVDTPADLARVRAVLGDSA